MRKCWMMVITVLLITAGASVNAFAGQWRQDDTGWGDGKEGGAQPIRLVV